MVTEHKHNGLTWIDLASPSAEEVRDVMNRFSINELVGEDLLSPTLKPKIDLYSHYIYLILHFPAFRHSHKETNQEIDFVVGKDFIITTHYDTIDPLHKFSKVFEVNSILDKSNIGDHAGFIFYYMIKKLYGALSHELEFISDKLKVIEKKVFSGKEKEMVLQLSEVSRELLIFKQALDLHDEVLGSFSAATKKFFGPDFDYYTHSIVGAYSRVNAGIRSNIDILNELRATNDSLLSTKQNETMMILAFVSFVMLPVSLIASIFGMNVENIPLINSADGLGFYKAVAVMVVVGFTIVAYFKYRRWL